MQQENIVDQQHRELTGSLNAIAEQLGKLNGSSPAAVAAPLAPVVNIDFDLNAIAVELQTLNTLLRILIETLARQNPVLPVVLPNIPPVPTPEARKKVLGIF